ncbi:MAG: IS5 family transposase [Fusobacteria bacterium]|nr:IS5 family transposase [Fusobacteriota bacterium]
MNRKEHIEILEPTAFKRLVGIKRSTYNKAYKILEVKQAMVLKNGKGGRPPKLTITDKLLITLTYLREYRTLLHIAFEYGVSEATTSRIVKEVEDILVKHTDFRLPGKKVLSETSYEFVVIDATEIEIDRPKKKQNEYSSGKKKEHTIKAQITISSKKQIICTSICEGKHHDFQLFKASRLPIKNETTVYVDSGYQGIQKIHSKSNLPKKRSKNNPLSDNDKRDNRLNASVRIIVEHINAKLKVFKILGTQYRNRRA